MTARGVCGQATHDRDRNVRFRLPDPVLLANALPGWGLLAAPAEFEVINPEATPYCVRSSDAELSKVLSDEWDREEVIARLPN